MGRERYWSRNFAKGTAEKDSAGCMGGMLQLFDFHQFQCFSQQQQQQKPAEPQKDPPALKKQSSSPGVEAPRNSLELEVDTISSSSSVLLTEVDIPIGTQVSPVARMSIEKDQSPETSSSQGSKTPNLVARLMGLELLPDQVSSPPMHKSSSFSSPMRSFYLHHHQQQRQSRRTLQRRDVILPVKESSRYDSDVRSLPDTPRISSSRRSDAERRFSLQLNKENIDALEFNCLGRSTASRDVLSTVSPFTLRSMRAKDHQGRFEDENNSPGTYAREIVKQVKESVGRRVGIDITNISSRHRSSDENLTATTVALSVDKCRRKGSEDSKQNKATVSASSPRLKFLETKSRRSENKEQSCVFTSPKLPPATKFQHCPSPLSATLAAQSPTVGAREAVPKHKPKPVLKSTTKCKKASCERFTQRPAATSPAARRKCTTPLSNTLVQIHPPINLIQNQALTVVSAPLPTELSQTKYDQQQKAKAVLAQQGHIEDADAELCYVRAILDQASATVSAPLLLDPSLFLQLELSFDATSSGPLKLRANRRLLFHLVDNLLLDALTPLRPSHPLSPLDAGEILCRLRSFPQAKCQTLQDIHALVGLDLADRYDEGEGREAIVAEVERQILDALVNDVLVLLVAGLR